MPVEMMTGVLAPPWLPLPTAFPRSAAGVWMAASLPLELDESVAEAEESVEAAPLTGSTSPV